MRPALERLIETLPAVFALGTLAAVVLAAVLGFGNAVPAVVVVGWLFLTPVSGILVYVLGVTGDTESADSIRESVRDEVSESLSSSGTDDSPDDDPLATLRDRYARGEIDDVEFEQRLERLLETEDIEVPPGATLEPDPTTDRADDTAAEREPVRER